MDTGDAGVLPHAVVGMLIEDGRVLLGHRNPSRRFYPDVWDLPGGHVDPGETGRAALARELREELGVVLVSALETRRVELSDIMLDVWTVTEWTGTPVNNAPDEHDELRWFTADELPIDTLAHPGLEPLVRTALNCTRRL